MVSQLAKSGYAGVLQTFCVWMTSDYSRLVLCGDSRW